MNCYLLSFLLLSLITVTKAHHLIKLIILAALGLAGLWMIQQLAMNFNLINTVPKLFGIGKRSIREHHSLIDWDTVLSRDPASCARSFICQLAAQDDSKLDTIGKNILRLTKYSANEDTWASKQLNQALKNGYQVDSPGQCMKIYRFCPYTSQTMVSLLRMFGSE